PRVIDHVTRCDPSVDLTKAAKDAAVLKAAGDLAPEGVLFIPADRNPTKRPLVVTCNEVSGTTTVWAVGPVK
ncbi:MAG: alkaline phosphatase, partial [Bacteroidia bacterium]|nr:alkaline phosphatase [Bacteroidia bacterium]